MVLGIQQDRLGICMHDISIHWPRMAETLCSKHYCGDNVEIVQNPFLASMTVHVVIAPVFVMVRA